MSAVIEVFNKRERVKRHVIEAGRVLIGRSRNCAISLDEELISREHAAILNEESGLWLQDLGSRNGTRLNGQRIVDRQKLSDGDTVSLGSHELRVSLMAEVLAADDQTRAYEAPAPERPDDQRIPKKSGTLRWDVKLRVVDGFLKGEVIKNWEGNLRIGRGQECEVSMISDAFLSLEHAQILQEDDVYYLVDLGSDNGTFLNQRRITPRQRERIKHGDTIRAGKECRFVFEQIDKERERHFRKKALWVLGSVLVLCALIIAFRPADRAGERVSAAQSYFKQGKFTEARSECEAALVFDPRRAEALELKGALDVQERADSLVENANALAVAGKWAEATGLCREALRLSPRHQRGTHLMEVMDSIRHANSAIEAQNWDGAIRTLQGLHSRFSKSDVIASQLELAKRELQAFRQLSKAREYLRNQEPDLAEKEMLTIPPGSTYAPEGQRLVSEIAAERSRRSALSGVAEAYRQGHLDEALSQLEKGLSASSNDPTLIKYRERIRRMLSLMAPLQDAARLSGESSVDVLLDGLGVCERVLSIESDPLNVLSKRASESMATIQRHLREIASKDVALSEVRDKEGNRRDACRLLLEALRAQPENRDIAAKAEAQRQAILTESANLYFAGYQLLGRDDLMAKTNFMAITNIGLPKLSSNTKELYYEKAIERLKELSRR